LACVITQCWRPITTRPRRHSANGIEEARQSGNSDLDTAAEWVDDQQVGVADATALESRVVEVLRLFDLEEDVYCFGLRGRVDPERQPEIAQSIVEARQVLADRLSRDDLGHLVERFASSRYNAKSSVSANLLFGTPIGSVFEGDGLARHAYVQLAGEDSATLVRGEDRDHLVLEPGRPAISIRNSCRSTAPHPSATPESSIAVQTSPPQRAEGAAATRLNRHRHRTRTVERLNFDRLYAISANH
jgi:hypothetical protein